MKKAFIYLLPILLFLFSCQTQKSYDKKSLPLEESSVYSEYEFSSDEKFNNPVLIYGSSFGHFFQQLYKQGRWDEMIKYTSQRSINTYGVDSIKRYYQNSDFGYDMKLKSRLIVNNVSTLNYESMIGNKKAITRLDVVVENDTCRLLIDNTYFHLGVTWTMAVHSLKESPVNANIK